MDNFLYFMQTKGVRFRSLLEGGSMVTFDGLGDFFGTISAIMLNATRMVYQQVGDLHWHLLFVLR
jgi:hypothetical protein